MLEEIGYCSGGNLKPYKNIFIEVNLQASLLHSMRKSDTMKLLARFLIFYLGGKMERTGPISLAGPEYA